MTNEPLFGPMVWDAASLPRTPLWDYSLSVEELAAFRMLVAGAELSTCTELAKRMQQVQTELENGSGVVRLRDVPIDHTKEAAYGIAFQKMASLVGTPVPQTASGDRLFRVEDAGLPDGSPKARGPNTRQALSFHSDRCDVIGFLCMRQAATGGENLIVSTPAIHNEILTHRPDLLSTLYASFPWKRHTFDEANRSCCSFMPVFSQFEGHFASNLMRILILRAHEDPSLPNLSADQIEALDLIESSANDPKFCFRFRQEPGDVVFLNNFITLHSRTAFTDADQNRLIYRVWLSVPNSRPLAPCWSANYGPTGAGELRGGIRTA